MKATMLVLCLATVFVAGCGKREQDSLAIQGVVLEKRESLLEEAGSRHSLVVAIGVKNASDQDIPFDRIVTVWYPFTPEGVKYIFDREYTASSNLLKAGQETCFWDESPFYLDDRPQDHRKKYHLDGLDSGVADGSIGFFIGVGVFRNGNIISSSGAYLPDDWLTLNRLTPFPSNVNLDMVNIGVVELSNLRKKATPLEFGAKGAYSDSVARVLKRPITSNHIFSKEKLWNPRTGQPLYTVRRGCVLPPRE